MKTRFISSIFIAIILFTAYAFMFTPVFDILVMVLAGAACYEVMKVAGVKSIPLRVVAILFSLALVLGVIYVSRVPVSLVAMAYVLGLVLLTVCSYPDIPFVDLAVTVYASFIIPLAFSTMSLVADMYKIFPGNIDRAETRLLLWNCVATALFTDVFAYLVGTKFGKHKMTPNLSPKKSWEGAIGGVVCVVLLNLGFLAVFHALTKESFFLPIWAYILMNIIVSILSIFGDLMASLIKRHYGAKDFSHLIPGHGGIMDRFDSVIMAAPAMYLFLMVYGLAVL